MTPRRRLSHVLQTRMCERTVVEKRKALTAKSAADQSGVLSDAAGLQRLPRGRNEEAGRLGGAQSVRPRHRQLALQGALAAAARQHQPPRQRCVRGSGCGGPGGGADAPAAVRLPGTTGGIIRQCGLKSPCMRVDLSVQKSSSQVVVGNRC